MDVTRSNENFHKNTKKTDKLRVDSKKNSTMMKVRQVKKRESEREKEKS